MASLQGLISTTNFKTAPFYLFADDFGCCEFFIGEESDLQYQVPLSGQWVIDSSFSIPIVDFEREVFKIKRKYKRRIIGITQRHLSRVAKNLPATWRMGRLTRQNGNLLAAQSSNRNASSKPKILKPLVEFGDRIESKFKKKRGRRPKIKMAVTPEPCQTTEINAIPETNDIALVTKSNAETPEHVVVVPEKRKRGRPPKSKRKLVPDAAPVEAVVAVEVKRKRGRPSKASLLLTSPVVCNGHPTDPLPLKKPGPKPKVYQPNFLQRAVQRLRIIEQGNKFLCNQCGRAFKQKLRCLSHLNVHRNRFKCLKCNKNYINKRHLVHHEMLVHHDEKPLKNK